MTTKTKTNAPKTNETEISWLPISQLYTATQAGKFVDNLGRLAIDDQGIAALAASMIAAGEHGEPYKFAAGPVNVVEGPASPGSFDYFPDLIVATPRTDTGSDDLAQSTEHKIDSASLKKAWASRKPKFRAVDGQRRTIAAFVASVILGRDFLIPCVILPNATDALDRVRANARTGQRDYSKQELAFATCELFERKPTATMGDIAALFNWQSIASSSGKLIPERNGERQHLLAIGRLHTRNPSLQIKDRLALPANDPRFIDAKNLTRDALPFVLQTKDKEAAKNNGFVETILAPIVGEYHPDSEGRFSEDQIEKIIGAMQQGTKAKATTLSAQTWRKLVEAYPPTSLPHQIAAAHLAGDETRFDQVIAALNAIEKAAKS